MEESAANQSPQAPEAPGGAWHRRTESVSLPEVHRSITVPGHLPFWRKTWAFVRPGFLVAVGYMDPGNRATDLAGGAQFGHARLSVVTIFSLMTVAFTLESRTQRTPGTRQPA